MLAFAMIGVEIEAAERRVQVIDLFWQPARNHSLGEATVHTVREVVLVVGGARIVRKPAAIWDLALNLRRRCVGRLSEIIVVAMFGRICAGCSPIPEVGFQPLSGCIMQTASRS